MKNIIGTALVIFFAVGSLFVFVGGLIVLVSAASLKPSLPLPPDPPIPPVLQEAGPDKPSNDVNVQRITLFTQQTTIYQQRVTAYKDHLTALQQKVGYDARLQGAYTTVISGSLISLLSTLITGLVGYAFVKGAATVAAAHVAAKHDTAAAQVDL